MNIVDSSAWLEYFADSRYAKHFSSAIELPDKLIVPSIILYEVFKKILSQQDEDAALLVIAHMKQGTVIDLDLDIALRAAHISSEQKLPMADSIILATARKHKATLWTMDSDFKGLPNVKYFSKR